MFLKSVSTYLVVIQFLIKIIYFATNFKSEDNSFWDTDLDTDPNPTETVFTRNQYNYFGEISINLNIYYDNHLFLLHNKDRTSVETFIKRTISSTSLTFRHPNIERVVKINFSLNIQPFNWQYKGPVLSGNYLNKFCQNVASKKSNGHVYGLFTGYDILSSKQNYSHGSKGIGNVNSICKGFACFLVEAKYYEAAIISSHEIGHVLGMAEHDEEDDLTIMQNSTGRGKTVWSDYSLAQINDFFNELKQNKTWCFTPSNATNIEIMTTDIDEQCRQMLGPEFKAYHRPKPLYNTPCERFWCRYGPFLIKGHVPLEYTECAGPNTYCYAGQCRKNSTITQN